MTDLTIRTLDATRTLPTETIAALQAAMRGAVALPGQDGYDAARTIWNAMIDRRPAVVARCLGAADVIQAVKLARRENLLVAVRGGGHNIAGTAVCDGGLLIDLSLMRSIRVDPAERTARVEPGATLADLDRETQAFALATPVGINSTTGIAGLTLGGGFGWTTRKFGLTIDNLLSADVVTAEGELVRASEKEHPDLFWAIRGGGGNFGIVTSFEFRLHPLGPQVLSGPRGPSARRRRRRCCPRTAESPTRRRTNSRSGRDAQGAAAAVPARRMAWQGGPDLRRLLRRRRGRGREGDEAAARARAPIADVVSPHSFVAWQAAFDPLLTPGARNYWKSADFADLADGAIEAVLSKACALPTPECEVFIAHVGGAMARIAPDATAWSNRSAHFVMNAHTRWRDPADDAACIAWARAPFRRREAVRLGQRLRQLPARGRGGQGRERVRGELPPPDGGQAPLRSRQPLPHEPEHPALGRTEGDMNERASLSGAEPVAVPAPSDPQALCAAALASHAEAPRRSIRRGPAGARDRSGLRGRARLAHGPHRARGRRVPRRRRSGRAHRPRSNGPQSDPARRHAAAARAWAEGDAALALERYGAMVVDDPRDVVALALAHALDFRLGRRRMLRDRVAQVLPEWNADSPATRACWRCTPSASKRTASTAGPKGPRIGRSPSTPAIPPQSTSSRMSSRCRGAHARAWRSSKRPSPHGRTAPASPCTLRGTRPCSISTRTSRRSARVYDAEIASARRPDLNALADASALLWRLLASRRRRRGTLAGAGATLGRNLLAGERPFFVMHACLAFAATEGRDARFAPSAPRARARRGARGDAPSGSAPAHPCARACWTSPAATTGPASLV